MSTAAEEVTNKAGAAEELTNAPLLPPELLTSVVEFSTFAEVHAAPRCVSREWRAAVRRATTHGRWKPVKFVADQGEALCRAGAVPAASCDIFRAAWAADPDEAFRLCLTWTVDVDPEETEDPDYPKHVFTPVRAARFLAVVEPTIDGLGRIMALCERAHRFTYAGRKIEAAMPREMYHDVEDYIADQIIGFSVENSAFKVISAWSRERTQRPGLHTRGEILNGLAAALESWADPAAAAHFAAGFFPESSEARASIDTAQQISRRWEDRDKAADFAAAAFTVQFEDRQKRLRTGQSDEWEGLFEREYSPYSSTKKQSAVDPDQDEFWANLAPVVAELDETLHLAGARDDPQLYYSQIAEMTMRPGDFY